MGLYDRINFFDDVTDVDIAQQLAAIPDPAPQTTSTPDEPSSLFRRIAGDTAVTALKGAIGLPESIVGLADIPTGGRVGKALENVGYRPREAKEILNELYSPEQKAAFSNVQQAKGFLPTLKAVVQDPSVIAHTALESAPQMLGGAGIARGALKTAPKLTPWVAGAIGEGAIGSGQQAESIRGETPDHLLTPQQAGMAGLSGVVTGMIGAGAGKFADTTGIANVETILARGAGKPINKGSARQITEGALTEGILEELPQSMQEQALRNIALGKPWHEGVLESGAQGMVTGGLMGAVGGGFNALGSRPPSETVSAEQAQQPEQASPATPPIASTVDMDSSPGFDSAVNRDEAPAVPVSSGPIGMALAAGGITSATMYQDFAANPFAEAPVVQPGGPAIAGQQVSDLLNAAKAPTELEQATRWADAVIAQDGGAATAVMNLRAADRTGRALVSEWKRRTKPQAIAGVTSAPGGVARDSQPGKTTQVDQAAHTAATSPTNSLPEPTTAQIEAGNYKKGHLKLHGLDISVENPAGSIRKGVDETGREWQTTLAHHYGYIKGTVGRDKDHIDIFVGPQPESNKLYVVDQLNTKTGKFDEHKVMAGFASAAEAQAGYLANYDQTGPQRIGNITEATPEQFKQWLSSGNTKQAFASQALATKDVASQNQVTMNDKRRSVKPDQDDLIVAIAKLGGLNREQATAQWGSTLNDMVRDLNLHATKNGKAGFLHAIAKTGRNLDEMRELLEEYGYLQPDSSIEDMYAKIEAATRGQQSYSNQREYREEEAYPFDLEGLNFPPPSTPKATSTNLRNVRRDVARNLPDEPAQGKGVAEEQKTAQRDPVKHRAFLQRMLAQAKGEKAKQRARKALERFEARAAAQEQKQRPAQEAPQFAGAETYPGSPEALQIDAEVLVDAEQLQAISDHFDAGQVRRLTSRDFFKSGTDSGNPDYGHRFKYSNNKPVRGVTSFAINADDDIIDAKVEAASGNGVLYAVRPQDVGGKFVVVRKSDNALFVYAANKVDTAAATVISSGEELQARAEALTKEKEELAHEIAESYSDDEIFTELAALGVEVTQEQAVSEASGVNDQEDAAPAQDQSETSQLQPTNDLEAGEELIYNKRNRVKGVTWDDVKDSPDALKAENVKKDKVYTKPDYAAMVDDGMNPLIAHLVKQVYDAIPSAPVTTKTPTDAVFQAYITGVNRVMNAAMQWANDKGMVAAWATKQGTAAGALLPGSTTNISNLVDKAKRPYDVAYPDGWREFKDEVYVLGGNKLLSRLQPGTDEAVRAVKDIDKGWPGKVSAWQKQGYAINNNADLSIREWAAKDGQRFAVRLKDRTLVSYDSREEAQAFIDNTKPFLLVFKNYSVKGSFETREEAEAAAKNLVTKEKKTGPDERGMNVAAAERTGPVRRLEGENVTAKQVMETFGFRGVNMGNWVPADEAQMHLNFIYDSLFDLAEIINVPPKALSLDGTLGIAVGAQGGGRGSAHYVPAYKEINITRTAGAGALTHELGHALDNWFGELGKWAADKKPYMSKHTSNNVNGEARPEVVTAFKDIMQVMNKRKETPAEFEARSNRAKESSETDLVKYANRMQTYFEGSSASDAVKEEAARLLERVRNKDTGDGYVAISSNRFVYPVVADLYQLTKKNKVSLQNGGKIDIKEFSWLNLALSSANRNNEVKQQRASHVPLMVNTDYRKASNAADGNKVADKLYWSTPWEMFARAFDAYVTDKVSDQQNRNSYLSGIEAVAPQGNERKEINEAFDKLFATLKTKETERGVALFAAGSKLPVRGLDVADVNKAAAAIISTFPGSPQVSVVRNFAALPEAIQAEAIKQEVGESFPGVLDGKQAFVLADNLDSVAHLETVLLHEIMGHYSIKQLFGSREIEKLNDLFHAMGGMPGLLKLARENQWDTVTDYARGFAKAGYDAETRRALMVHELLAHQAQIKRPALIKAIKEYIGAIKAWLREHGFTWLSETSTDDLAYVLRQAREVMTSPASMTGGTHFMTARHSIDLIKEVEIPGNPGIESASPVKSVLERLSVSRSKPDDTIRQPEGVKAGISSVDTAIEQRWQAANGLSDGPNLKERMQGFLQRMLSERQHFPNLDTSSFSGKRTADILRRFESSSVAAKAKTAEYLHSLTASFGPQKMDLFSRKVVLDDLINEAKKGRALPFGYTPETVRADHERISKLVAANPDVQNAVKQRTETSKQLVLELVDNDLLPVESVLTPEGLENYKTTGRYTADDINTGYFRHQVLEHANARKWAGLSTAGEVRNKLRGWQKGREGSELDINTNFLEAEFEYYSQAMKELATKKALDDVLSINDLAPELREQAKQKGAADWKTLIPEGYTTWQPEKGSVFYKGQTMPESIITRFIEQNPAFAEVAQKFKDVLILGGRKEEVVIPEGLAKTLDNLRTNREDATLDTINKKLIGGWKVWTLLSPRRALKYNLNNMSGDLDIVLAADPGIMKHFATAWRNAMNRKTGKPMTFEELAMLDRGVIDAGISINEIPDISKLPGFQHLQEGTRNVKLLEALKTGDLTKLAPANLIANYFDKVSGLTQLREGLLREAAYLRAKELLDQGKPIYWASNPAEINSLTNVRDKAAKLSRELLGDYGNLSAHGEKIRTSLIPFWSWMEINAPRYYRLFRNAATQGEAGSTAVRLAGVGARKVAGAALGIGEKVLLTHLLFAAVSAFNHLVHPDEEEKLSAQVRGQLHLILGTTSDGKTLTLRFSGAFSDVLAWVGLEDYPESFKKLQVGQMDASEMLKKMTLATPNKLVNAASPFTKLAGELMTGKSIFPDMTKPIPIRDRAEHAARFLALDEEYRALAGKPGKGYLNSLKNLLVYESDPGENAYHNTRQQVSRFLEKHGREQVMAEPTERSKALYYFRQAMKYRDREAIDKYKAEYLKAGGKPENLYQSIKRAHPLAGLPLSMRQQFLKNLSAQDRENIDFALAWYKQAYR